MFSFICVWINGWINNRHGEAGDLRRYYAHYDVTVMGTVRGMHICEPSMTLSSMKARIVRSEQNGRLFANDIFKYITLKENSCILNQISLKCVHQGPINNKSALIQLMAWCGTGDKPLSEPVTMQFTDEHIRYNASVNWHTMGSWVWSAMMMLSQRLSRACFIVGAKCLALNYGWRSSPFSRPRRILTHWRRDKMAAIFQTTFSNAFSWIKMCKLRLRFHWSLFPSV